MTDKVVDASAIVALLFNEASREEVVARLRDVPLRAPVLIRFEVANACLKKIRAAPHEREELLEAFALFEALPIELNAIDLREAIPLAARTRLSVSDASYLWLAYTLGLELVTLDDELARADTALRQSQQSS